MARFAILFALCALSAAAVDTERPVISLDLAKIGSGDKAKDYAFLKHEVADKKNIPCESLAANQDECSQVKNQPTKEQKKAKTYYAFCYVGKDDANSCPEPEASAHDHHDGDLQVQKKVMLVIDSPPHSGPQMVKKIVSHINYKRRGEYRLIFDAQDKSGNKADTVYFHFFIVDHERPQITVPPMDTLKAFPVNQRWFNLQFQATDNYDGDVSDTIQIKVTKPNGKTSVVKASHVNIDTHLPGKTNLHVYAHDYASAFGKNYKSNGVARTGYTLAHSNHKITVHFGAHDLSYTPKETPHEVPTHAAYHKLHKKHTYIPPVIMLFDTDTNNMIGRGSAWGKQQNENNYRMHLRSVGLSKEEEEAHVAAIVAREQRIARMLGQNHKWHDSTKFMAEDNVEIRFVTSNVSSWYMASALCAVAGLALLGFTGSKQAATSVPV
jgi:hypothetical protein